MLIPAYFLLASCGAAPLYLEVAQSDDGLVAKVYEKWWFGLRSSETPCVHDVTLMHNTDYNVVWRAGVDSDRQCSGLKSFVIGHAPRGFRDEIRLSGALPAGSYKLTADGIGYGAYEFTLPLSR